jgi:poly(hydroxyalkanoate) depolymerase family esterase
MYTYIPAGISGPAPLVIAMHGCTETASQYSAQTGWNKLANLNKFYVVYPEQVSANNSSLCFNWFDTTDINKNQGEALSIKQMVDYMKANHSIDPTQVYVTGLSAGAGMTVVMLATYPDVFKKGAVMAGLPYKAATSATYAYTAMNGGVVKTPAQWGALVRAQNPAYTSPFPHMAIFHGTADYTVNNGNATELIKQWTNLNHADQVVDSTANSFQGNANVVQTIYNDSTGNPVVYYYKILNMGHAIAVDTGKCPRQGGSTATYSLEQPNFHSSYWAADFFQILASPYTVAGSINVSAGASGTVYSVTSTAGSSYVWTVPPGATITAGQGTASITLSFGTKSGYVQVTETTSNGCKDVPAKLYVTVNTTSGITEASHTAHLFYVAQDNSLHAEGLNFQEMKSLEVFNAVGQRVRVAYSAQANVIQFDHTLTPGMYIVHLSSDKEQHSLRFIAY